MSFSEKSLVRACCLSLLFASLPLIVSTGCKPSAEKLAAREARISQEVEELLTKSQSLEADNRSSEALALVEQGLANSKYQNQKTLLFTRKVELMLTAGQEREARELILRSWKDSPDVARSVYDKVFTHYQLRNATADTLSWCSDLLALGTSLPADIRTQVLSRQLTLGLSLKDTGVVTSTVRAITEAIPVAEAIDMLQRAFNVLLDSGNHAFVADMLAQLESDALRAPEYQGMLSTLSLRCVIAAKDWDQAMPVFTKCVTQLPDAQLVKLSRVFFAALQKSGKAPLLEQASHLIVFTAPTKANAVNLASRVWVECGVSANKKAVNERLLALLDAKVSPVQVGNLFDRYFYDMVDDLAIVRGLCAVGEKILASCDDTNTVNSVKVKILDGAFITENYDLAVHMLEQGIPGKDKAWHDMSLPKVKAHRAMAQNKPREAVKYFRDFMNTWIASDQKEEFDPTSGIAYSRAWILGRNAKRIAGILDSIPDKAEADKARAEAKEFFKTALKNAENDTEALKLLKEETKDMGL